MANNALSSLRSALLLAAGLGGSAPCPAFAGASAPEPTQRAHHRGQPPDWHEVVDAQRAGPERSTGVRARLRPREPGVLDLVHGRALGVGHQLRRGREREQLEGEAGEAGDGGVLERGDLVPVGGEGGGGRGVEVGGHGQGALPVAALEHASVASFARFTLELLALGAPPDLLAAAQQAGLDEVEHARLAYALASRFAGRPLGPGPLCTADLALDRPLAAFVTALVHEGCIGETLGAAEAELLAEHADPGLATLLRRIATDETGHAALAWQTLRWLHDRHGEVVRQAARAALAAAELDLDDDLDDRPAATSAAWGLLPRRTLLAHRRRTLDAVVRPILGAVLGADESTDLS